MVGRLSRSPAGQLKQLFAPPPAVQVRQVQSHSHCAPPAQASWPAPVAPSHWQTGFICASISGLPASLQVARVYWQVGPVAPPTHEQTPLAPMVPPLLQVLSLCSQLVPVYPAWQLHVGMSSAVALTVPRLPQVKVLLN